MVRTKFVNINEIKLYGCPFCNTRLIRLSNSVRCADFYCKECQLEMLFWLRIRLTGYRYILENWEHKKFCEKHNGTYDEVCPDCKQEELKQTLKDLKIPKEWIKFIRDNYYLLGDDII